MSLGGLAIAIGMMVDGSVVMMEHIFSRLGEHEKAENPSSIPLVIQESAREMGRPVFFAVMIIIVFASLFTLHGVEGKLFQPMAQSIVLAMLASLLKALVVVPAPASFVFRSRVNHRNSPLMVPLSAFYNLTLAWALRRRSIITGTALALLQKVCRNISASSRPYRIFLICTAISRTLSS